MQRRSRAIIAATIVAIGIGVVGLGFLEDESTVRYVSDVHATPANFAAGTYTLLGVPQPEQLTTGANPDYDANITTTRAWSEGGVDYLTHSQSSVEETNPGEWTFTIQSTTTTRSSQEIMDQSTDTWTLRGDLRVFQVDDFETGQTTWAAFGGVLNGEVQPKPSQLTGRLADAPSGLLVWMVDPDGYTVGCSSKFLPDEVQDEYDADGDGYTD